MRTILKYMLCCAAVLSGTACSKDDLNGTGEGAVSLNISYLQNTATSRSASGPDQVKIRVYRNDGELVRRYDSTAEVPALLYLMAGQYTLDVEAGDPTNTAFFCSDDQERLNKLYFKLDKPEPFEVKANSSDTKVSVTVPTQNVGATMCFDPTAADSENIYLSDVKIDVVAMPLGGIRPEDSQAFEQAAAGRPMLTFDQFNTPQHAQDGYFLMPEGVSSLVYRFSATHAESGAFTRIGEITDKAESGKRYKTTFKYTLAPSGSFGISVSVIEETVETHRDHVEFKPQPDLTADAGFDLSEMQPYVEGQSVTFTCTGIVDISTIKLDNKLIFNREPIENAVPGVSVIKESGTVVKVTLDPEWFRSEAAEDGEAVFYIDESYSYTYRFAKPGLLAITEKDYNLWTNTATFRAIITDETENVKIQFRRKGGSWNTVTAVKGSDKFVYEATVTAAWETTTNDNSLTVYKPNPDKCIFANNTYEYQLLLNDSPSGEIKTVSTTTTQSIPYGDMEDATLTCWTQNNRYAPYWGSGNNNDSKTLCTQATYAGMEGDHCAKLQAANPGYVGIYMLASGNLFLGTFYRSGSTGTVYFGLPYTWEARPASMKMKLWHDIGTVDKTDKANRGDQYVKLQKGEPDQASIYVVIVDWNTPRQVASGTGIPTGMWSADEQAELTDSYGGGKIIGYGIIYPTGKTAGSSMEEVTIPIVYYDKETKPSKNYTLVIGCSTSRYGDYMNGCMTNVMYVDDFRWGY